MNALGSSSRMRFGVSTALALGVLLSGCVLIGYDPAAADGEGADGGDAGESGAGGEGGAGGESGAGGGGGAGGMAGQGTGGMAGAMDASVDGALDGDVPLDSGDDTGAADDGAITDDAGDDSGATAGCGSIGEGEACDDGLFCMVGETCIAGVCGGGAMPDCSSMTDACNAGVCHELAGGCVKEPVADDTACGSQLTCQAGRCESTLACPPGDTCDDFTCLTSPCHFECREADGCTSACNGGAECSTDCAEANNCDPTCNGGSCEIDCSGANNCKVTCASGASCDIDCKDANNCDAVVCTTGSSCVLRCEGATNCEYQVCGIAQLPTVCPNDVLVCNGTCPP